MKDIQWFLDHLESGKTIKRTAYDKETKRTAVSYQRVDSKKKADYLFDLQSEHITFEENRPAKKTDDPFESDESVIRIHKLDIDAGCESCSA